MRSFGSDNNSGIHPLVMQSIIDANQNHAIGYGSDQWTERADHQMKKIFGEDISVYYVFNGTGANVLALQAATRPFHSIIAAETGHISVDECGAPTKFTGCPIKEIQTNDGKLTPELIAMKLHGLNDQHHSQPKVVYLSQTTELGTIYTEQELKAICDYAHKYDMFVHMDGARLANACAKLNMGLRELSRDCGIDILSFGGTKNGMMMGEAIVSFRPELGQYLKYYRKQSAQLYSKMRFLSAQFSAYLEDNLWLKNAQHANDMAMLLAEKIKNIPGIQFTQKIESNALFLAMPKHVISKMSEEYFFYTWNEANNEIRLVCSWDTTVEDIESFSNSLDRLVKK